MKSFIAKRVISIFVNSRYLQLNLLKYKENNKKICDTFDHNFYIIPLYIWQARYWLKGIIWYYMMVPLPKFFQKWRLIRFAMKFFVCMYFFFWSRFEEVCDKDLINGSHNNTWIFLWSCFEVCDKILLMVVIIRLFFFFSDHVLKKYATRIWPIMTAAARSNHSESELEAWDCRCCCTMKASRLLMALSSFWTCWEPSRIGPTMSSTRTAGCSLVLDFWLDSSAR